MQYTHEVTLTVEAPWRSIWAEWNTIHRLPHLLSHICATEPIDSEDMAHFTILLEGRQVEFAAQRTMCADQTLCWQSCGSLFLYVLSLRLEKPKRSSGIELTLSVAYDPPGFLPDIAESLGLSRRFKHELESDFHRYVHTLQMNCVSELASVD
ncbi:MAG: hypothetical protein ACRYFS_04530 [Janthinobacterium lividum]